MKNRIIAFFLALVMLFSCLSLNIFATASEEGGEAVTDVTEGSVVEEVGDVVTIYGKHTDEQMTAYITQLDVSTTTDKGTDQNYGTSLGSQNAGKRLSITADGRFAYCSRKDANGNAIVVPEGSTSTKGSGNSYLDLGYHKGRALLQYYSGKQRGASFVNSIDIELTDVILERDVDCSIPLFDITTYLSNTGYDHDYNTATPLKMNSLNTVARSIAQLYVYGKDNTVALRVHDAYKGWKVVKTLEIGENYTLAMHASPKNVDAAAGVYGTYDFYVNNELVAKDVALFNAEHNAAMTFDQVNPTPYFIDSAFDNWKIKADQIAYFFLDSTTFVDENSNGIHDPFEADTDGDGIPEIYKNVEGINKNTVPVKTVFIGTANGVQDFVRETVRNFNTKELFTDTAFYADNLITYLVNDDYKYVDVTKHNLVADAHTHTYDKDATLSYSCNLTSCPEKKLVALDANGDKVCDFCIPRGGALTVDEIKESGVVYKAATGFDESIGLSLGGGTNVIINREQDSSGNYYIAYYNKTYKDDYEGEANHANNIYMQQYMISSISGYASDAYSSALANFANGNAGRGYTISFDFFLGDGYIDNSAGTNLGEYTSFFEIMCYLGKYTDENNKNKLKTVGITPLTLTADGKICCRENGNTNRELSYQLEEEKWYTMVLHHDVKNCTFDFFVNGVCVADDFNPLSATQMSELTWTSSSVTTTDKTGGVNIDVTEIFTTLFPSGMEMTPEKFMPTFIRFPQYGKDRMTANIAFGYDNVKIYYTETNIECTHKWIHNHNAAENELIYTCEYCGKVAENTIAMVSDFSPLTGTGSFKTPAEIKASDIEYKIATEFTGEKKDGISFQDGEAEGALAFGSDAEGNAFIEWRNPSMLDDDSSNDQLSGATYDTYNAYAQISLSSNARHDAINWINTTRGKGYTVSFSFQVDSSYAQTGDVTMLQVMCYLNKGMTDTTTSNDVVYFSPLTLKKDGTLVCTYFSEDGKTKLYKGIALDRNEWYDIVVHHQPKAGEAGTYDIFLNGECILNDVRALSSDDDNNLKWSYPVAQMPYGDKKTATKDDNGNVMKDENGNPLVAVRGGKDYAPHYLRFPQLKSRSATAFRLDNVKMYYTETNIECTHKCTTSSKCDLCGVVLDYNWCDSCGGHMLASGAAVAERNATLGDEIGLNFYLNISEQLLSDEDAKIVLTAEGRAPVEYVVSELKIDETTGKYKVTLPLRSIDMARTVTVTATGTEDSFVYKTSLFEYLIELKKSDDRSEVDALVDAMLNYGTYAQDYFKSINSEINIPEKKPNIVLLERYRTFNSEKIDSEINEHKISGTSSADSVTITGASLVLASSTKMKVFFTAPENATVSINGDSVSKYRSEVEGEYYVIITKATPASLDSTDNVVISVDSSDVVSVDIRVLSAVQAVIANPNSSEEFDNLARAIYLYAKAADAYEAVKQ